MKQFKYNMVSISVDSYSSDLINLLNEHGLEGWEVISMFKSSDQCRFNILLKKEIIKDKIASFCL